MNLVSLLDDHTRLDELFLSCQEALLERDLTGAEILLAEFERGLRAHMRMEEEILMPYYRRAGRIQGGPPEFYTGEHKRMLEALERIKTALAQLDPASRGFKRAIITVFDLAAAFKSLTEHHHDREETIFYPTLDSVTDADERAELLARCQTALSSQWPALEPAGDA